MTPIFPEFERELVDLASQEADLAQSSRPRRERLRWLPWRAGIQELPVIVAVAISLLVAVIAATSLRGGHRAAHPSTVTHSPASAQSLTAILGILRRAQTNADRRQIEPPAIPGFFRLTGRCASEAARSPVCHSTLDRPLVRAVHISSFGGLTVGIYPERIQPQGSSSPAHFAVELQLLGNGIYYANSLNDERAPGTATASTIQSHGALLSASARPGVDRGVILVPDGVASVVLQTFRLTHQPTARTKAIFYTSTTVHNNISAFELNDVTLADFHLNQTKLGRFRSFRAGHDCTLTHVVYNLPATAQMRWFNAQHQQIKHQQITLAIDVATDHPHPNVIPSRDCRHHSG